MDQTLRDAFTPWWMKAGKLSATDQLAKAEWQEELHPRERGRFAPKGEGKPAAGESKPPTGEKPVAALGGEGDRDVKMKDFDNTLRDAWDSLKRLGGKKVVDPDKDPDLHDLSGRVGHAELRARELGLDGDAKSLRSAHRIILGMQEGDDAIDEANLEDIKSAIRRASIDPDIEEGK